jgi:hypothetical protein
MGADGSLEWRPHPPSATQTWLSVVRLPGEKSSVTCH